MLLKLTRQRSMIDLDTTFSNTNNTELSKQYELSAKASNLQNAQSFTTMRRAYPAGIYSRRSGVFIVNFEFFSHFVLVFLLLTFNL